MGWSLINPNWSWLEGFGARSTRIGVGWKGFNREEAKLDWVGARPTRIGVGWKGFNREGGQVGLVGARVGQLNWPIVEIGWLTVHNKEIYHCDTD